MTNQSFGVSIEETIDGIPYLAGFELLLYPAWADDTAYALDAKISYTDDLVYKCILAHTSSVDNAPDGINGLTYWQVTTKDRTEFNISADHFQIATPNGTVPIFSVDGDTGEVSIYGSMVIYGDIPNTPTSLSDINASEYSDLTNFVDTIYPTDIAAIQSQIDGNITTWFYDGEPSLITAPVDSWTTDAIKDTHLGDLYYDNTTGYAYRFRKVVDVYSWLQITDTDVVKALNDAAAAQDTADNKRRVFITTPTPPYDVGDLWDQGSTLGIWRCNTAKVTGTYAASDWQVIADKTSENTAYDVSYINAVAAEEVLQNITDAQTAANDAQATADGKVTTFYQATSPTADGVGDLWIDTDNGNKAYRWSGSA